MFQSPGPLIVLSSNLKVHKLSSAPIFMHTRNPLWQSLGLQMYHSISLQEEKNCPLCQSPGPQTVPTACLQVQKCLLFQTPCQPTVLSASLTVTTVVLVCRPGPGQKNTVFFQSLGPQTVLSTSIQKTVFSTSLHIHKLSSLPLSRSTNCTLC